MVTPRKGSHGNKHRISYQSKKVPSATSGGLRSCSSAVIDSSTSIVRSSSNASTSSCTLSEPSVSASVTSLLSIRRSLKDQVGCGRPSPVDNASLRGLSRSDRRSSAPSSCRCSDTTCCMWLIPESDTSIFSTCQFTNTVAAKSIALLLERWFHGLGTLASELGEPKELQHTGTGSRSVRCSWCGR